MNIDVLFSFEFVLCSLDFRRCVLVETKVREKALETFKWQLQSCDVRLDGRL